MPMHTEERSASPPPVSSVAPQAQAGSDPATGDEPAVLLPTGPAAAAILAAGIGAFALGLCAILGDAFAAVAQLFDWVPRTGPLSGVTGCAVVLWLLSWWRLQRRWRERPIQLQGINRLATVLFVIGLLLSFPPLMDLLQGK